MVSIHQSLDHCLPSSRSTAVSSLLLLSPAMVTKHSSSSYSLISSILGNIIMGGVVTELLRNINKLLLSMLRSRSVLAPSLVGVIMMALSENIFRATPKSCHAIFFFTGNCYKQNKNKNTKIQQYRDEKGAREIHSKFVFTHTSCCSTLTSFKRNIIMLEMTIRTTFDNVNNREMVPACTGPKAFLQNGNERRDNDHGHTRRDCSPEQSTVLGIVP
mmetsp:Transcript_26295/g.43201  ORF Transcript_26295/g.43201 Transcript_26295/m.43201 type:complete len:216 (+) Transcript_26295:160-807(+)